MKGKQTHLKRKKMNDKFRLASKNETKKVLLLEFVSTLFC